MSDFKCDKCGHLTCLAKGEGHQCAENDSRSSACSAFDALLREFYTAKSPKGISAMIGRHLKAHPPERGSGEAAILFIMRGSSRTIYDEIQEEIQEQSA